MNAMRWALLALLISPAWAQAGSPLAEAVSEGRVSFDQGRSVGIQSGSVSAGAVFEAGENVSFVLPTAVDGQGTEADPIPLPKRAKRPRGLSANFDRAALALLENPKVPVRPTGLLLLGLLGTLATGLTAGGLLTES